jgi:hypothetical protein
MRRPSGLNKEHEADPCPFCHADASYLRYRAKPGKTFDGIGVLEEDYPHVQSILCSFCGASGPTGDSADLAVLKWNRRDA